MRILHAQLVNNVLAAGDDWAKVGRGKHLEPGLVTYDEADGSKKKYLLTREGIAALRPSAVGKPIIGKAGGFDHMKVTAQDAAAGKYDGDVIKSYDGGDGWEWIDFLVRNAETKEKCQDGYQFSCAYLPETDGQPGLWHNEPYDEKIIGGTYTHFAVVPNPRYEGATIELMNSKGGILNKALKAILSSLVPVAQLKEIVNSIEDDAKKEDAAREKAKASDEKLNAMKPDELHEHIIKNYAGELLSGEHSPELGALLEKGAKANKMEVKDYAKKSGSDAKMFNHGMKNAEETRKKSDFDEAMKNAKSDEEKKALEDAYNKAPEAAAPKEAPKGDAKAEPEAPKGDVPKPPIGGGDVVSEPGLPGQEKPKANAEDDLKKKAEAEALEKKNAEEKEKADKEALEKKNAEEKEKADKEALEKKNADEAEAKKKAEAEKTNAIKVKENAKREAASVERFNALRKAAEERGSGGGIALVGVVSTEEKQDLGRARYGS